MKFNFNTYNDDRNPNDVYLLIQAWKDSTHHYGNMSFKPVYLRTTSWTSGVHAGQTADIYDYYGDYVHSGECILHWFDISCIWLIYGGDQYIKNRDPYAIQAGYRDIEIDIDHLEGIEMRLRFLKKIAAQMKKMNDEYGKWNSFKEYVLRVAKILGVKGFLVRTNTMGEYIQTYRLVDKREISGIIEYALQHDELPPYLFQ